MQQQIFYNSGVGPHSRRVLWLRYFTY